LIEILRDWRYTMPLAALAAITIIALVLAGSRRHAAANGDSTSAGTATAAPVVGTPSPGDVLLDARRRLDLAALRDALEDYHSRFGAYPSTGDVYQGVCGVAGEALCALKWVTTKLPYDDPNTGYRYRSNGAAYVLVSPIASNGDSGGCPNDRPPEYSGVSVFCLASAERPQ
jgi:hypothetical protein